MLSCFVTEQFVETISTTNNKFTNMFKKLI